MHGIPKTLAILASLFVGLPSWASDPPVSPIRLPFVKQELPKPLPADQVVPLTADVTYVIESDVPVLVFSSPGGSVSFEKIPGPARLRGAFIGGTGAKEWKTFTSKYLVVVDALKNGRDELVVLPVGAKDEAEAKRVTFQIGQMPIPPPIEPVDPVLTPFQTKLKAAIKADGAMPSQVALYAALFRNAAKTTVHDDGLQTSAALLGEMQRAVKLLGLPAGSLDKTARVVADELNTLVPKTNIVLDKPTRDNIATVFTRISADLEAAK